jgi:hypothetical protein
MSGRVISLHRYRNGGGNDSGFKGKQDYDSGFSTSELYDAAERNFFDHEGREKMNARMRAYMHVLLSNPDRMQQQLREGLEMGGFLQGIPSTAPFPVNVGSLSFGSEKELRMLTDPEVYEKVMNRIQTERAEALSVYREWATKLIEDLTTLAEARVNGASPEEILTTKDLRLALTTEMVSQNMIANITSTRRKVQEAISNLAKMSESGVRAAPLAVTMQQIGRLCQTLNQDMERLEKMASVTAGPRDRSSFGKTHSGVITLTKRAKDIFSPFIEGNHLITMEQLRELESFLKETGGYNKNIGELIEDGLRAIQEAKQDGRHLDVRKLEGFLRLPEQVEGFERITRALDQDFLTRSGILANVEAQNRIILRSTPPGILNEAELQSGLRAKWLLGEKWNREMDLVLPANDDLELR